MLKNVLTIFLLFATPAFAQTSRPVEAEEAKTEEKAEEQTEETARDPDFITLRAGVDLTTQYFSRGILQENQGAIGQPWIELRAHLYQGNGPISDVFLLGRNWNSFHSGPTGTGGADSSSPASWFETKATFGLGVQFFKVLTVSGGYTISFSPNDRFETTEEMFVWGELADKELWNLKGEVGFLKWEFDGIRLQGGFVWETDGQRNPGVNDGVYAEIGAKPGVTLHPCEDFTARLSVPVVVGFNVFEYYETPGKGDAPFGFFSLGFEGEVPLKWISSRWGEWSIYGSITWYNLGQNVAHFNGDHNDEVIGGGGLRFSY
jgi:hypothetical protein